MLHLGKMCKFNDTTIKTVNPKADLIQLNRNVYNSLIEHATAFSLMQFKASNWIFVHQISNLVELVYSNRHKCQCVSQHESEYALRSLPQQYRSNLRASIFQIQANKPKNNSSKVLAIIFIDDSSIDLQNRKRNVHTQRQRMVWIERERENTQHRFWS